ncbi:unnamed protein product [Penicillium olsonii]|uniref:Uncharacterized protein n=1 Tax=Penicillium olsonii TaxID=99116 RepID=A0A9W4MRV5_PENOL|nr:unnamed protein product [Penicillium olsonii]CAG8121007.1 unnamed protein product [Penicillium olsonii]
MEKEIPVAVQYASCYWIRHLQQSTIDPTGDTDVLDFFQYRFLYWLETLALIGRLSDALVLMEVLGKKVSIPNTKPQSWSWLSKKLIGKSEMLRSPRNDVSIPLHLVLDDAKRFLRRHISTIENAPLQLYSSAMMFSPTSSITKQRYYHELSNWTLSKPGLTEEWESHLQQFVCSDLIGDVAISQGSNLLCVGLINGDVHLWEIATGIERKVLSTNEWISALGLSPDGSLLAIGFRDGGVSLWDLTTLSLLHSLETEGEVIQVAFSPSGNVVASCRRALHTWDVNTGVKLHTLIHQDSDDSWFQPRNLSLDCASIAIRTGHSKHEIRDTMTGATRWSIQDDSLLGGLERIDDYGRCQVSPNGNLVVLGLGCSPVKWALFDIATGKKRVWKPFKFYRNWHPSTRFAFSHDNELIAVSNDSRIEIFHIKKWKMLARLYDHKLHIEGLSFSPNSQLLACGTGWSVSLWDITTCERWHMSGSCTKQARKSISLVNGSMFESSDNESIFWDPKTLKSRNMKIPKTSLNKIALSLDGKLLASICFGGRVYLCDTGTGALKHTFPTKDVKRQRQTAAVGISPNCEFVAVVSKSGVVSIWNSTTGKRHLQILPRKQPKEEYSWLTKPQKIVFSLDSRLMALGFGDGVISIWGIEHDTACARTEFSYSDSEIWALAFSPDTKFLASGSNDSQLCLWDTTTGTKRRVLQVSPEDNHISGPSFMVFSRDGELVASALYSGLVTLWHVKSGTIHQTITTGAYLRSLFFSGTDLITNRGVLPLSDNSQSIFVSNDWIMVGRQRVVYIPPDYRESLAFVSGDIIGLLDSSGQVRTLRYNRP